MAMVKREKKRRQSTGLRQLRTTTSSFLRASRTAICRLQWSLLHPQLPALGPPRGRDETPESRQRDELPSGTYPPRLAARAHDIDTIIYTAIDPKFPKYSDHAAILVLSSTFFSLVSTDGRFPRTAATFYVVSTTARLLLVQLKPSRSRDTRLLIPTARVFCSSRGQRLIDLLLNCFLLFW